MSNELFIILFTVSDIICFLSLLWIGRIEHRLKTTIMQLLGISCITTTLYLGTLISNSVPITKFLFCCYFASIDWLCGILLYFILQFTNFKYNPKLKYLVAVVLAIDSISMVLNNWLNHAVDFVLQTRLNYVHLHFIPKGFFYIHLTICYAQIIGLFALLIYRIIVEPKIQKVQHITVFLILFVIIGTNALFLFTGVDVDISIVGYGVGAVLISYYTAFYLEKQLRAKMSVMFAESFNVGIILFDNRGMIFYENEESKKWDGERGIDRDAVFKTLHINSNDVRDRFIVDRAVETSSGIKTMHIKYSSLMEQDIRGNRRVAGSYLVLDDISDQIERLKQREYAMSHDDLTGLFNRNYFLEQVPVLMQENPDTRFSIFITNIYQFKLYNEIFGFEAGNQLLRRIGSEFIEKIRTPKSLCARYGEDRFVACIPTELCTSKVFEEHQLTDLVGLSNYTVVNYIGICHIPEDSQESVAVICERAAMALNTIKGDATKRNVVFNPTMRAILLEGNEIVNEFPNALKNGQITIYIQPQINQATNQIVGGEVLARWIDEYGNFISPGVFVPILEQHGLITKMDRYIWESAFKFAKELKDQRMGIPLSVNISIQDLYCCDIHQVFTELSKKYELPEMFINIEITESNVMNDMDKQIELIKRLQKSGFKIEMDDFGSGYSSLNSLKDIPVDVIKMDLRFFEKSDDLKKGEKIIRTILQLGKSLEIPVIAEGVETEVQAEFLKKLECKYIQGYLYGKPMSMDEFAKFRSSYEYSEIR